ncbi:MAG: replication initiator protein A, partial [Lachnospiraceae bacterium]|nr:replication initiator protein A [Lachnospiraceae bacterium]
MTEYLTTGANLPPYMIFPKFLLDSGLSETTKLLYMLLLDRTRLSMKNDGWTDAQGHAFIYFTI